MASLQYRELIREDVCGLRKLHGKQSKALYRRRLQFLMLLKSGKCLTQHSAGVLIGINGRQSEKLWKRYTSGGIDALLQRSKAGRPSKMNEAARLSLQAQLDDSHVATLQQACGFVLQQHGVVLTQQAMHYYFKRTGIKKKTGRPTNIRKDVEGAEMFKKTLC